MGWSIGGPDVRGRFVGYGVPAYCDHPDCNERINRGLSYVCCDQQPYGGDDGCGLYFCGEHHNWKGQCERCVALENDSDANPESFAPKPEHPEWIAHMLSDSSWAAWRLENPNDVAKLRGAA